MRAPVDPASQRTDYRRASLDAADVDVDPIRQFSSWYDAAAAAGVPEVNAMTLATVDADGRPSARIVLLKEIDDRGFVFYTNLESRKAQHITANPNVSLLFPWIALERQVIVTGTAAKVPLRETLKYFLTRPRESQLAAWASQQSHAISSRKVLEMEWARLKEKFGKGKIPLPSFWGGFRVKPETIEFWQGGPHRLHDRFQYTLQGDGTWVIERLAP